MSQRRTQRGGGGTRHRELVGRYVASGFKTSEFLERLTADILGRSCRAKCVCKPCEMCAEESGPLFVAICEHGCHWRKVYRGFTEAFPHVPDAWKIEPDGSVICVEVDVTNPTSDRKLAAYGTLWWEIDGYEERALTVLVVDRFGIERRFSGLELGYQPVFRTVAQPETVQ